MPAGYGVEVTPLEGTSLNTSQPAGMFAPVVIFLKLSIREYLVKEAHNVRIL